MMCTVLCGRRLRRKPFRGAFSGGPDHETTFVPLDLLKPLFAVAENVLHRGGHGVRAAASGRVFDHCGQHSDIAAQPVGFVGQGEAGISYVAGSERGRAVTLSLLWFSAAKIVRASCSIVPILLPLSLWDVPDWPGKRPRELGTKWPAWTDKSARSAHCGTIQRTPNSCCLWPKLGLVVPDGAAVHALLDVRSPRGRS